MPEKRGNSRLDILSLNLGAIREIVRSGQHFQLALSENGVELPKLDRSLKSWAHSTPYDISFSRNKIGTPLIKPHRNGFLLHDPHMFQSRFFVDYHRLQDPGLKKYLNSPTVRNRLKELNLMTEDDDVICTKKEFAEYLRYLEQIRALSFGNLTSMAVRIFAITIFFYFASYSEFIVHFYRKKRNYPKIFKLYRTEKNMNLNLLEFFDAKNIEVFAN